MKDKCYSPHGLINLQVGPINRKVSIFVENVSISKLLENGGNTKHVLVLALILQNMLVYM